MRVWIFSIIVRTMCWKGRLSIIRISWKQCRRRRISCWWRSM